MPDKREPRHEVLQAMYNGQIPDVLNDIARMKAYLAWLKNERAKESPCVTAEQVYEEYIYRQKEGIKPIHSGTPWWDEWAGPFRRGNSYTIAGYPGVGKTTLALNLAWSLAQKYKVWFYCIELTPIEQFEVLAGHILKKAVLNEADFCLAYSHIQPTGMRFFRSPGYLTWQQHLDLICDTVRQEKASIVFIDNLMALISTLKNTVEVETHTALRIKGLAQELDIPIVLIHHLRKPDSDGSEPEPNMHSMRGSGAIAALASDTFILHHPLIDKENQSRSGTGYLLSGKPRWGRGGKRYVNLNGSTRSYTEATRRDYEAENPKKKKAMRQREYDD